MPTTITTLFFLSIFIAPSITEDRVNDYNKETNLLLDDFELSLSRIDSAISMSQEIDYDYGEAYALFQKGYIYDVRNEQGKALIANLSALKILEGYDTEESAKLSIDLYTNTGLILRKHFKYDQAIQYYMEGVELVDRYNNAENKPYLYYKIGNAYKHQGSLETSIEWLTKAHNLGVDQADEYIAVNSLNLIGLAYNESGQYDNARDYFQKMVDFDYNELSPIKYWGRAHHNIAYTYLMERDFKNAERYFEKSLAEKNQRNKADEVFITEFKFAELYMLKGQLDLAEKMALSAESRYDVLRKDPINYQLFALLRKIEFQKGNYSMAEGFAAKYEQENQLFINRQQELIQIRDQFKMDLLTTSYFSELERERQISQLTNAIYFIVLFIFIGFTLWKIRQMYMKRMLERELRTAIQDFNLDDL